MGPNAIRSAGVVQRLEYLGYNVRDEGDLLVRRPSSLPLVSMTASNLKHLDEIVRVNEELCQIVAKTSVEARLPLIIGGDHSIAIGALAGISQRINKVGLIWFDAHSDVNTADTTPSGNIHGMSLAVTLGYGHPLLTGIGGTLAKVTPEHSVIVGARSIDRGERDFLRRAGVSIFTIRDIERLGIAEVMEKAIAIAADGTDGIHLSLDLDALDPRDAPGVGTPIPGGVTMRESLLAMEMIADTGMLCSAEFVEVNPLLDHGNQTAQVAVELISSLFGERIL
jgi:arginase